MANENTTSNVGNGANTQGNQSLADICVVETIGEDGVLSSVISRPEAGETLEVTMLPGQNYVFDFAEGDVEDLSQQDGNLVLTFADGSSIILNGFDEASNADIPALVAFSEDGSGDDIVEITQATPDEEILEEPQAEVREEAPSQEQEVAALNEQAEALAQTEPAAGDEPTAEELAQVEPAAGDAPAAAPGGNSNTGFGFGSATQAAPLVSNDAIGPLLRTALNYGIQLPQDQLFPNLANAVAPFGPNIGAPDQVLFEDTADTIVLTIAPSRGSSILEITIGGIPPNWTVDPNGGTYDSGAGTWTFTTVPGVTFTGGPILTPPHDSDVDLLDLPLTVTETDTSTGDTITQNTTFDIFVDAVADAPDLVAQNTTDVEDAVQDLDITTSVVDIDGSEVIQKLVIEDVPPGFTLNNGVFDPVSGNWTLTEADLVNLEITPPAHFHGTIDLVVESFAEERNLSDFELTSANNIASKRYAFSVTWTPTIDPPTITVNNGIDEVQVKEDGTVDVPLVANLNANHDPVEFLTVTVTGIDPAWGFSAPIGTYDSGTGTWTYTAPADSAVNTVLTFTPPAESDIDLTGLVATVVATDPVANISASSNDDFKIVVDAVADKPTIQADDESTIQGVPLDVDFTGALGSDNFDGSESIVDFTLTNVPDTFTLTDNGVTVVPTSTTGGIATYVFPVGTDVSNLQLVPPPTYTGTLTLNVTINTQDTPAGGTDGEFDLTDNTNFATTDFELEWTPRQPPEITVNLGVDEVQVKEDGTVDVPLVATLGAGHAPTEVLTVTVTGIDSTWGFSAPIGTYNAGTGTWTFTAPADTDVNTIMTFTPPAQSDVDLTGLVASASVVDPTVPGLTLNAPDDAFFITVDAVADKPDVDVTDKAIDEGTPVALNVFSDLGADKTDNSESITGYQITGVPAGFTFNAGTVDPNDSTVWNFTPAEIVGLEITPPNATYVGAHNFEITLFNEETTLSGGEYDLTDNTNFDTDAFTVEWKPDSVPVITKGTAAVDETDLDPTTSNAGKLVINTGTDTLASVDGTGTFNMNGLTSGGDTVNVTFVAGAGNNPDIYTGTANDGSGDRTVFTFTLEKDGDYNFVLHDAVDHADANDPNDSRVITFGVSATDNEGDVGTGVVDVTLFDDGPVANDDVFCVGADYHPPEPEIEVNNGTEDVCIKEDGSAIVPIEASYEGGDGDEVMTITLEGAAVNGWIITAPGWVKDGNDWKITLPAGQKTFNDDVTFTPPADSDEDLPNLQAVASVFDPDTNQAYISTDTFNVITDAVVDAPVVTTGSTKGTWYYTHTGKIGINVKAAVGDLDGSEEIQKVVIDLNGRFNTGGRGGITNYEQTGAYLNKGVETSPGIWEITVTGQDANAELAGLTMIIPWDGSRHGQNSGNTYLHNYYGAGDHTAQIKIDVYVSETNLSGQEKDYSDNATVVTKYAPVTMHLTPLILDLDGDGIELIAGDQGVFFDMVTDGGVMDQTAWAGPDDGILAIDKNNDGRITDRTELFGDTEGFSDGFDKLDSYDSNNDNVINANDADYSKLLVWKDVNTDGVSQEGELFSLADLGITSINLNANVTNQQINGQQIILESTFTINGQTNTIVDALFETINGNLLVPPAAVNDVDGATTSNTITASVLHNDTLSEDDANSVTAVTFNGTTHTIAAGGSVTVVGSYGTLVMGSDGKFTYTANNGIAVQQEEIFTYELTDSDGDKDTAQLKLLVKEGDSKPIITNGVDTVDETDLDISETGTINVDYGSDSAGSVQGNNSFNATGSVETGTLRSGGTPVDVNYNAGTGTYVGTAGGAPVFTLKINTDGTYVYNQTGTLDHADPNDPNDIIALNFGIIATDNEGDTGTGTLTINVKDDAPSAVDDVFCVVSGDDHPVVVDAENTVDETGGFDVVNGTVDFDPNGATVMGDDSFTSSYALTSCEHPVDVTFSGDTYTGRANGEVIFTLQIGADGSYTFEQFKQLDHADDTDHNDVVSLNFGVKATAGSNSDDGIIKINVFDDGPQPGVGETVSATNYYQGRTLKKGNLLSNDDVGQDGGGHIVTLSAYGQSIDIPDGDEVNILLRTSAWRSWKGGEVLSTGNAYLTVKSDGSYTVEYGWASDQDGGASKYAYRLQNADAIWEYNGGGDGSHQHQWKTHSIDYVFADKDGDTSDATITIRAYQTPLVLDLDGDGIELVNAQNGVFFDMETDGGILDQTAWAGPDDGLLAIDKDGDGRITDRTELFGDTEGFSDGFDKLDSYDSDNNGVIDVNDADFSKLLVWKDTNTDGVSQESELFSLTDLGITSINLNANATNQVINGQDIILESTFTINGQTHAIVDALFETIDGNSLVPAGNPADVDGASASNTINASVLHNDGLSEDDANSITAVHFNGATHTVAAGGSVSITGLYGTLVMNSDGKFTYTANDDIAVQQQELFTYTLTDSDGDSSTAELKLLVKPDTDTDPVITDGNTSVDETNLNPTTTGTGTLAIDTGTDTLVSVGGTGTFNMNGLTSNGDVVNVNFVAGAGNNPDVYTGTANDGSGNRTVFTFTIENDADYSFVLHDAVDHADATDHNDVRSISFGVKATDDDNDTGTGLVNVALYDDGPVITEQARAVDESGLENGNVVINGSMSIDFGEDGPSATNAVAGTNVFEAKDDVNGAPINLQSQGNAVNVTFNAGTNTYTGTSSAGTVFTLAINSNNGNYTYTQFQPIDHPDVNDVNDIIWLKFGTKVTDYDQDTDTGYIIIDVKDDWPVAHDDTDSADNGETVTGNVVANDDLSVDAENTVTQIQIGGTSVNVPAVGTAFIAGAFGSLTIAANGDYSYVANGGNVEGIDQFTYTLTDGDGDYDTAKLTVEVGEDDEPVVLSTTNSVDETGGFDTVSGNVNVDYGSDAPGAVMGTDSFTSSYALESCGHAVDVSFSGDTYTGKANGQTVFTLKVEADGDYTFQQFKQLDHADKNDPNDVVHLDFGVKATDSDGDVGNGTITISVYDDGPKAVDDGSHAVRLNFNYGGNLLHGHVNILGNDSFGQDGAGKIVSVSFVGSGTTTLHQSVQSGFGRATADHSVSIVNNKINYHVDWSNNDNGTQGRAVALGYTGGIQFGHRPGPTIQYIIEDKDGDRSTAYLDIYYDGPPSDSPLVLDLDGDGVELVDIDDGVKFDIDNDGDLEQTAWVDADDGLLVRDQNGDGLITDRTELFGDTEGYTDGFDKLGSFDDNNDGVIDAKDEVWSELQVWQDVNQDGVSDAAELLSLEQLEIVSLNLTTTQPEGLYIEGSWISHIGSYTTADGEEHQIVDAWFGSDELPVYATDGAADVFSFDDLADSVSTIEGFDTVDGDVIDISSLLTEAEDEVSGAISDFVSMREEGGNTVISVDLDGRGAGDALDIVTLSGTIDLDVNEMVDNGNMVI